PDPGSSNQSGYDEQHTVTPIASHGLRRNEYVLDNKVKYELNKYDNHYFLSAKNYCFMSNLCKSYESSSFEEALKDVNWISAINDDMHALYENDTWYMTDLPARRKPIGSKWVFRMKYKSNGEIEKYKARLVAKGYYKKEGTDENECTKFKQFLSNKFKIKDLGELKPVMTPLPKNVILAHKESENDKCLLTPGSGIQFSKRQNGFNVIAFSDSDWAKSKKQATLSRSSAEAEYRSMAADACEVMSIVKIMKDLNVDNLIPADLYCDNKSAIQIAANPVMHEKN
ncbi:ribonuclease H-like domain-containing protein, partial [Tanacetum coccineum]